MYLAYKKDDIYVKIVACLFISCFIVMCFIGSVFAISTIQIIPYRGNNYNLTIDTSNKICKLNNTNITNDIWNYENFAFFNYGDDSLPYLYIYVWNGDLKIGKGVAPRVSKL